MRAKTIGLLEEALQELSDLLLHNSSLYMLPKYIIYFKWQIRFLPSYFLSLKRHHLKIDCCMWIFNCLSAIC